MSDVALAVKADPLQLLRAAGLRPTTARMGVLKVLEAEAPRRMDAGAVFRVLLLRGMGASQGAMYRALKELIAHGLVFQEWRNGLSGGKAVYSLRPPGAEAGRTRIECEHCGSSTAISDVGFLAQLRQLASSQGMEFAERPMTVRVVCTHCDRSSQPPGPARNSPLAKRRS